MPFRFMRARRLRRSEPIRRWVRENELRSADLAMPFFVVHGENIRRAIPSMPGQFQLSIDQLLIEAARVDRSGIPAVLLFGIPKKKDPFGREAYAADGIVQRATRALKKKCPALIVMTDLCFCEYTTHGHCGVVKKNKKGRWDVDNDATLGLIRRAAVAQAKAGSDFISPSGMTDGAVAAIRSALDGAGFKDTSILAYSAKFASVFYGPFRDAAGSAPQFGDRRGYQMDPANLREALREIESDVAEGADLVMVKPALSYLDVISQARAVSRVPVAAYNVSGEYAMVKAAEKMGWLDGARECRAALEILTSIKRAGADVIITYHALEVAPLLKKGAALAPQRGERVG